MQLQGHNLGLLWEVAMINMNVTEGIAIPGEQKQVLHHPNQFWAPKLSEEGTSPSEWLEQTIQAHRKFKLCQIPTYVW